MHPAHLTIHSMVHTSCGDLSGSDMHPAHLTINKPFLDPVVHLGFPYTVSISCIHCKR